MARFRSPTLRLVALAMLAPLLLGLPACGCDTPVPSGEASWGEPVNGLALRLAFDEARYRTDEPMSITVEARNLTPESMTLWHFEDETWWYHVRFENLGEGPDFMGGAGLFVDFSEPPNHTLAAGAVWKKQAELGDERRRFLRIIEDRRPGDDWDYRSSLPPGRYRAFIEYAPAGSSEDGLWKGMVRTNAVEIEVVPAKDE